MSQSSAEYGTDAEEEEMETLSTGAEVPNCFCQKLARMLVSWTDRNPRRRFFRCDEI